MVRMKIYVSLTRIDVDFLIFLSQIIMKIFPRGWARNIYSEYHESNPGPLS